MLVEIGDRTAHCCDCGGGSNEGTVAMARNLDPVINIVHWVVASDPCLAKQDN